jgi:Predicted exonuclease of the beta-lactamase fold involved in RNA processing
MLNLKFIGAARTTTGSMHLVDYNGRRILLDCGLFQGHRKEAFEMNRTFPFDPREIDAIVLSHAHIDHCGRIPALVRQGYRGRIYATPATRDLADVLLRDSAFLQERDVEYVNKKRRKLGKNLFELLYNERDIDRTMPLFTTLDYGESAELAEGLRLTFNDAGHILGSATATLDYTRHGKPRRLLFTGDLGQADTPFLNCPAPVPDVDVLITESTYGDRLHPPRENIRGRLKDYIDFVVQHRSKLVIPAFSVGRTQQILYYFNSLVNREGALPVKFFVDSPLSQKATEIHRDHDECFNERTRAILRSGDDPFAFPGLRFTASVSDSMALNDLRGPMVIISASGMCEGGRVVHHLANTMSDPENVILITGFQAENTLGRRIVEGANPVRIFGEERALRATVFTINGLSAHADSAGLAQFAKELGSVQQAFCVHGELPYCEANKANLEAAGIRNVEIPNPGQRYDDV